MVQVRLFAALREAAGVPEVQVPAGPLDGILAGLGDRFGDRFAAVLAYSSVLAVGEHGVRVRLRTELLGQPVEAVATGRLGARGNAITFTPEKVQLGGGLDQ